MTIAAMIGNGITGVFSFISVDSHSGDFPPGVGSTSTERPSQTKDMPSVTTIDGRSRMWMSAPTSM
ncbi:hypothetical protein D3C83_178850 [compost metagenome]